MSTSSLHDVAALLLEDEMDIARADFTGRRVLVRVDFNVPISDGTVADWSRVAGASRTLAHLSAKGARVIIASHLGRPDPTRQSGDEMRAKYSLAPLVPRLRSDFGPCFQGLLDDCIGPEVEKRTAELQDGQMVLLENTRFHAGDVRNDGELAAALGRLADDFVNDAFGVCHRDQASVTGLPAHVERCFPGFLVRDEVKYLLHSLDQPQRPFACVVGGAKVHDKIGVLWALIDKAEKILVGGRMAYTLLASQGVAVGATQIEHDWLQPATEMIQHAKAKGVKLILPVDCVCTSDLDSSEPCCVRPLTPGCCTSAAPCVPDGFFGADIGPASCRLFADELSTCNSAFWNGPMGRFEVEAYARGTQAVAQALADMSSGGGTTVVGGGDSVSAIHRLNLQDRFTHVSTGGGASLEFIEGKGMPGLRALVNSGPASSRARK